jgi:type I restriction enzyme R subunit
LRSATRYQLYPILDACVASYNTELDEDAQVAFNWKAKMFVRTYSVLSTVLPYSLREWELLATFVNFLVPELPAPKA